MHRLRKFTKSLTIPVNLRNYCFTQGCHEFPKISRDFVKLLNLLCNFSTILLNCRKHATFYQRVLSSAGMFRQSSKEKTDHHPALCHWRLIQVPVFIVIAECKQGKKHVGSCIVTVNSSKYLWLWSLQNMRLCTLTVNSSKYLWLWSLQNMRLCTLTVNSSKYLWLWSLQNMRLCTLTVNSSKYLWLWSLQNVKLCTLTVNSSKYLWLWSLQNMRLCTLTVNSSKYLWLIIAKHVRPCFVTANSNKYLWFWPF